MNVRIRFGRPKCLVGLVVLSFLCLMIFGIGFVTKSDNYSSKQKDLNSDAINDLPLSFRPESAHVSNNVNTKHLYPDMSSVPPETRHENSRKQNPTDPAVSEGEAKYPAPDYDVHLFYYPWYGSPEVDGKYLHWNHRYLRHWDPKEAAKWPEGRHSPPADIGSNFYPRLGPYSSRDPRILDDHMRQIRSSGAGVLVVSWYPVGSADDEGEDLDSALPLILDHAVEYKLKVCVHIEPYKNRNYKNMRENIKYISDKYGNHTAFYRKLHSSGRMVPLYYIYDSYLMPDEEWKKILHPESEFTVRNTDLDGIFLGLLVEKRHAMSLMSSGFDGFYTYFASDGFTFGSSMANWGYLSRFAAEHRMLFVPSVGPGYIDETVRPWNSANTKNRHDGDYYERSFRAAVDASPSAISITSFNEWHEGTQIEEAVPKVIDSFTYLDYQPHGHDYYLMLTRKWIFKFRRRLNIDGVKKPA